MADSGPTDPPVAYIYIGVSGESLIVQNRHRSQPMTVILQRNAVGSAPLAPIILAPQEIHNLGRLPISYTLVSVAPCPTEDARTYAHVEQKTDFPSGFSDPCESAVPAGFTWQVRNSHPSARIQVVTNQVVNGVTYPGFSGILRPTEEYELGCSNVSVGIGNYSALYNLVSAVWAP